MLKNIQSFEKLLEHLENLGWSEEVLEKNYRLEPSENGYDNEIGRASLYEQYKEYISNGEGELAFETLCENISEFGVSISLDTFKIIQMVAKSNDFGEHHLSFLRKCIKN